jgi:hypothetical protein
MCYQRAAEAYWHECDMRDVCLTSCSNFLSNLARYLGVPPEDLAQGVKTLKSQHEEALKLLEEGQQPAEQEQLKELEAQNQELERALTSMGEVLQQHTSRWATVRVMLNKVQELASPSLYVAGKEFLRGLQSQDALQSANLLLLIINTLPGEIALKINNVRSLVGEVRSMYDVIVPAYHWDKGQKTFERISGTEGPAAGNCMSEVQGCIPNTNPNLPVMGQLPELEKNVVHPNFSGPDLDCPQD